MQAGTTYMQHHNQVAVIVYRSICAKYGLEVSKSKWKIPSNVVENDRAKILLAF